MIAPRVKTQAKSQNYSSRALKWGILCICSLNTFGVTVKCEKRLVFLFLHFCKKVMKSLYKIAKNTKIQKSILFVFDHISYDIWVTETYNTSFWSSWLLVLTYSLMFDSRSDSFWFMNQNVSSKLLSTVSIMDQFEFNGNIILLKLENKWEEELQDIGFELWTFPRLTP